LDLQAEASDAECALVGGKKFDLESMPCLQVVFKCGIGVDNLDQEALQRRGIELCLPSEATMEIICDETASFACAQILSALYRDCGDFETWTKVPRRGARETTLLVVGHGRIGQRVANRMRGFMNVETYDARTHAPHQLEELLARAHVTSLHLPLTAETRGLIGAKELACMPAGAVLVNTARGGIVDEEALAAAVASGKVVAYLDVFAKEPYSGPMRAGPGLYLTPHVASSSQAFLAGLARDFREVLQRYEHSKWNGQARSDVKDTCSGGDAPRNSRVA
jgi:phosphoglycerate dehydrogenase-like enzyme